MNWQNWMIRMRSMKITEQRKEDGIFTELMGVQLMTEWETIHGHEHHRH